MAYWVKREILCVDSMCPVSTAGLYLIILLIFILAAIEWKESKMYELCCRWLRETAGKDTYLWWTNVVGFFRFHLFSCPNVPINFLLMFQSLAFLLVEPLRMKDSEPDIFSNHHSEGLSRNKDRFTCVSLEGEKRRQSQILGDTFSHVFSPTPNKEMRSCCLFPSFFEERLIGI